VYVAGRSQKTIKTELDRKCDYWRLRPPPRKWNIKNSLTIEMPKTKCQMPKNPKKISKKSKIFMPKLVRSQFRPANFLCTWKPCLKVSVFAIFNDYCKKLSTSFPVQPTVTIEQWALIGYCLFTLSWFGQFGQTMGAGHYYFDEMRTWFKISFLSSQNSIFTKQTV
jgi:hypothetical protein